DRFRRLARLLQRGRHPDMTDLDHAIGFVETHEGAHAGGLSRGAADKGIEPGVAAFLLLREPGRESIEIGERTIAHIGPHRAFGVARGKCVIEIAAMLLRDDRLEPYPA